MKKIEVGTILLVVILIATSMVVVPGILTVAQGGELSFDLIAPGELGYWIRVCEIFKRSCEDIGIKINVKAMETGAWVSAMMDTHDFDIAMCGMLMEPTPSYLPLLFHSKYAEGGFNIAGVNDSELDALLDQSQVTVDQEELKNIIWQIQERIAENVYSIPIFAEDVVFAYSNKFTGIIGIPSDGAVNIWSYINMRRTSGEGGEMKIGMLGDIKTNNPLLRTLSLEGYIEHMVFETLVAFDVNLTVVPWLAESWEVSENGTVWTFNLRNNVTWQDGVPFTADDVVFTIETVLENKPPTWYSYFELIDRAEAVDNYTVRVYMKQPYAWTLTTFASFEILPKHLWKDVPWNTTNPPMIGTGPFKWVKWEKGEYIELEKNPNYWQAGKPHLDRVLWTVYETGSAEVLALRSGEVDLMYRYIPLESIKTLIEDPNIVVGVSPGLNFRYFIPNLRRAPFNDINLRKALAYAVDKETIVNAIMLGYASPIDSFVPQAWGKWNNPNVPKYEYNLTKANEILDKAGYLDVDGDGIRELPGTPAPSAVPFWVWIAVAVVITAVCSGGATYVVLKRKAKT
ncbi:MAG: ABC transporter substrate-binding protein [Candidatus Baldrarchaeia archaeon]